ncbi:MAG: hypothetical protein JRH11_03030 [Deltaproteobacteria bacterium]|nr:hypothetical protein [Deltaproteobacteria bacterium]
MWNDRQKAQGIDIELARIKRELVDQDRELEELMDDHYVTHGDLDALAATEFEAAAPSQTDAPEPSFRGSFVVRG